MISRSSCPISMMTREEHEAFHVAQGMPLICMSATRRIVRIGWSLPIDIVACGASRSGQTTRPWKMRDDQGRKRRTP